MGFSVKGILKEGFLKEYRCSGGFLQGLACRVRVRAQGSTGFICTRGSLMGSFSVRIEFLLSIVVRVY